MKTLQHIGIISVVIFTVSFLGVSPSTAPVQAQPTQDIVCKNIDSPECENAGGGTTSNLTHKAVNILTFFIGAISVIVGVIAGFMYVISGGNPDKTKRAKDALLYALIGVVIAVSAQAIVQFVLSSV